jgi:Bacterial capsule synthesis protein PGA_cap
MGSCSAPSVSAVWQRGALVLGGLLIISAACGPAPRPALSPQPTALGGVESASFVEPAVQSEMPPPSPTTSPPIVPVRIAFGGDVHGEPPIRAAVLRGEEQFAGVRSVLDGADVVMVNLETTVSGVGAALPRQFSFNAPAALLTELKRAGVSVVNLANNHSGDFGTEALLDTIAQARAVGLVTVGAGTNALEVYTPAVVTARGIRIGFLGFGRNIPDDAAVVGPNSPGQADGRDPSFVYEVVRAARATVDVLVVMAHMGIEGASCPTTRDRTFVEAVLDGGATVFVGNHPHVLQGIVERDGRLAMYSNGNFLFYSVHAEQRRSAVLTVDVQGDGRVVGHALHPVLLNARGQPELVGPADRIAALGALAELSRPGRCGG